MYKRFRLCLVKEQEACGNLSSNAEPMLPRDDRRIPSSEQAIIKASVGHILIDKATVFRTGTQKQDHVRMSNAAQYLNLHIK